MYPTRVSSKLCEFILPLEQAEHQEGGGHSPRQAGHFDQGLTPPGNVVDDAHDVDDDAHDVDDHDDDSSQADHFDQGLTPPGGDSGHNVVVGHDDHDVDDDHDDDSSRAYQVDQDWSPHLRLWFS